MNWRRVADWAKQRPFALQLADGLGRGRGRLRVLDQLNPPPAPRRKPSLRDWENRSLSAVWIGHATVLLRIGGRTILTDPVMSNRIGVGMGVLTVGPRRLVAPALTLDHLPPIDLILLSHAHFDHLDRPTLVKLPRKIPVVTAYRNSDLVRDLGFRHTTELRWGDTTTVAGLTLSACEVKHWGARTFHDTYRGYNGYTIDGGGRRIFFAGDTAYRRFPDLGRVDLAIFGIGAYDPYIAAHATPEQAWQMCDQVRADWLLPMHHSTFRLSHEPIEEPIERMRAAAGRSEDRLIAREVGDQWTLPE